jgi:hypothetical protein
MGRITTPTFRVEVLISGWRFAPFGGWDTRTAGRPSERNLEGYVRRFERSTLPGGANEHLGPTEVRSAVVIRQSTGDTVATFRRR